MYSIYICIYVYMHIFVCMLYIYIYIYIYIYNLKGRLEAWKVAQRVKRSQKG